VFERMIEGEMTDGETAGILVWGDPMLYDSTIRNIEAIAAGGRHHFEYEVIPGITAVQALAARHKIALNRIAEPVALTTGRRLAEGFPPGIDSVAVLLDGEDTYRRFADAEVHGDMEIYWGAYLGTPDEILIAGKLADVADEIHRRRAEARRANGWIMDTYVMRRPAT
jgi:precorrin-6A synthase